MEDLETLYSRWTIGVHIVLIFFVALLVNFVSQRVLRRLDARFEEEGHVWRHALVSSLVSPLQVGVWLVAASLALKVYSPGPERTALQDTLEPILALGGVFVVSWFLIRATGAMERTLYAVAAATGKTVDRMATDAVAKIVQAVIVLMALLEGLRILGLSFSGLVAFGGIGGIAIGFASQGLVSNLVGGLTVYLSQPFKVGEWVIMPEDNVMGQVQSIGWRSTRILGFDRRPFYVPNSKFNTAILINHSRMTNRRIQEYIHVRYEDIQRIPAIVEDAHKYISEHPGIDQEFFVVNFDSYGDFALRLYVYAFTLTTSYVEYMQIKEEVLLAIADIIRQHGAQLAVPTSTIHVPKGIQWHSPADASPADSPPMDAPPQDLPPTDPLSHDPESVDPDREDPDLADLHDAYR